MFEATAIVNVEVPEPGAGSVLGLKLAVACEGKPEIDKLIALVKPFIAVVVIVDVP